MAAQGEQFILHRLQVFPCRRCNVVRCHLSQPSVQFIHRAVGFDAEVVLADAAATEQSCGAVVSCSGVNAHAASYNATG